MVQPNSLKTYDAEPDSVTEKYPARLIEELGRLIAAQFTTTYVKAHHSCRHTIRRPGPGGLLQIDDGGLLIAMYDVRLVLGEAKSEDEPTC